jgi:predicted lipoprotein with Yx(FWY)xxD motif
MSAFGSGKLALGAAGATALVALIAGCASSSSSSPAGGAPNTGQTGSGASTLKTQSTAIGTVLVDPSGHTVYELVGDTAAKQTCTSSCQVIWPPVNANGSQMVVNGHPAFTFAADTSPGQTKGQNVTDQWGRWLALDASGNPISAPTTPSSKPAQSSSSAKAPGGGGGPAF